MSDYIFDDLDQRLKRYAEENQKSPTSVRLDLYTYLELKRELGYEENDLDSTVKTWNGFHVIVDINEDDRTIQFL